MAIEKDVFNVDAQASYMRFIANDLADGAKKSALDKNPESLNPIDAADSIAKALDVGKVGSEYINAVMDLKDDPVIQQAVNIFHGALEGKEDILKIRDLMPKTKEGTQRKNFVAFRDDPGLNGAVIREVVPEGEDSNLVSYSNYISGAGTTFGGFMADFPSTISDLASGIKNTSLFRYYRLTDKLNMNTRELSKVIDDNDLFMRRMLIDSGAAWHKKGGYRVDLSRANTEDILQRLKSKPLDDKLKKLQSTLQLDVEVKSATLKNAGKLKAQKLLGRVGSVIGGATTAFGGATGVIDITAGDEMIDKAEEKLKNKEISLEEYNTLMRDARFRIAQGSFGVGDALNNVRQMVVDKLGDTVKGFSKGAKMGLRFASAVGGAFAIGMGITSVTKNAIAAHDASEAGNIGKAAMYGIMASLDCVSVVLDAVSVVCDFVPIIGQAISFVLDLVNTIVGVINMIIGFFADMVDTRTPEEKLRDSMDEYIKSDQFQTYLRNQENAYRDQGFDVFKLFVDAEALKFFEADADGSKVMETFISALTEKAKEDVNDETLRMAILDNSSIGRDLKGRMNDDIIKAGIGKDTLHGYAGDDLLFGEAGDDTIYGGPGNDFLDGGMGIDTLFGGEGDDFIVCRPGVTSDISGGPGTDTVQLVADHFKPFNKNESFTVRNFRELSLDKGCVNRVFIDLSYTAANGEKTGRTGIALGGLLYGIDMLKNPMHYPGFTDGSYYATAVRNLFDTSVYTLTDEERTAELGNKYLWLLAKDATWKYLTDGETFYRAKRSDNFNTVQRANTRISQMDPWEALVPIGKKLMHYRYNPFNAAINFAFREGGKVTGVEYITGGDKYDDEKISEVHAQVIGDDNLRMVDLKGGENEYVYAGNTDTLIMCTLRPSTEYSMLKFIHGGSGNNTLIINGANDDNQCILLDHNVNLPAVNRESNICNHGLWPSSKTKVDRGIFLKNVSTIQIRGTDDVTAPFFVDAVNVSACHRFIIDTHSCTKFIGTTKDDNVSINRLGNQSVIDGNLGKNMVSMQGYPYLGSKVTIELGSPGSIETADFRADLKRFRTVRGSFAVKNIKGHVTEDNLLIADGGLCKVEARGGNNCLVAMRGIHTLHGGPGQDAYEVYGPVIPEFFTVSVTRTRAEGIYPTTTIMSQWYRGKLYVKPIKSEYDLSITTASVKVVDGEGNNVSGKGIAYRGQFRDTIIFSPGEDFNHLGRGEVETVRISYATEGSIAEIKETHEGNRLALRSVEKSDLKLRIRNKFLELTTKAGKVIARDIHWRDLYLQGVTSLTKLAENFSSRFPVIQFKRSTTVSTTANADLANGTSEVDKSWRMEKEEIYDFIIAELGSLQKPPAATNSDRQESPVFDSIFDTQASKAQLIVLRDGVHVVRARRRRVTYRIESSQADVIFDLTYLGKREVSVGNKWRTYVDAYAGQVLVAISVDNPEPVHIRFQDLGETQKIGGTKTLVIKGALPSDITLQESDISLMNHQFTHEPTSKVIVHMDCKPDVIWFSKGEGEDKIQVLVDDVGNFWNAKHSSGVYHSRRLYDSKLRQQLDISDLRKPYRFSLRIATRRMSLNVTLLEKGVEICTFPVQYAPENDIDAVKVAQSFELYCFRGFKTSNGEQILRSGIRAIVMECFRSKEYIFVGGRTTSRTVHASKVDLPYTVQAGSTLIYADREYGQISGGNGNNIIRVMASHTTVNPGNPLADGFGEVRIMPKPTNTHISSSTSCYYLFLNGYRSTDMVWESGNTLKLRNPGWVPWRYTMVRRDPTICTFGTLAPKLVFAAHGNQIEVISVDRAHGDPKVPLIITESRRVMLNAVTRTSASLRVGCHYSKLRFFYTIPSEGMAEGMAEGMVKLHEFDIGFQMFHNWRSDLSIEHAAAYMAACTPAGIRFSDRTIRVNELQDFCQEVLQRPLLYSSLPGTNQFAQSDPNASSFEEILKDLLKNHDVNKALVDATENASTSLEIINIDPEKKRGQVAATTKAELFSMEEQARDAPAPVVLSPVYYPVPHSYYKNSEKSVAFTWKGLTTFPTQITWKGETRIGIVQCEQGRIVNNFMVGTAVRLLSAELLMKGDDSHDSRYENDYILLRVEGPVGSFWSAMVFSNYLERWER